MSRHVHPHLIVLALWLVSVSPASAQDQSQSAERFNTLVAQLTAGDTSIDFNELRMTYPYSDNYDPYAGHSGALFEEIWTAFNADDCGMVLTKSDDFLKMDFVYPTIHALRSECFMKTGDQKRADLETAIMKGLVDSLRKSGDGKTTKTAYKVVTLREEYYALQALGIKQEKQALVSDENGAFDLMTGSYKDTGQPAAVFFDVNALFGGLARELSANASK